MKAERNKNCLIIKMEPCVVAVRLVVKGLDKKKGKELKEFLYKILEQGINSSCTKE